MSIIPAIGGDGRRKIRSSRPTLDKILFSKRRSQHDSVHFLILVPVFRKEAQGRGHRTQGHRGIGAERYRQMDLWKLEPAWST